MRRASNARSSSIAIFAKISLPLDAYNTTSSLAVRSWPLTAEAAGTAAKSQRPTANQGGSIMTMLQALSAAGRDPEIPPEADIYGWLVGSWELDVIHYMHDVRSRAIKGSAHFG